MRWVAASMFSCYKQRRFGEFVRATNCENMVKDVVLTMLIC